MPPRARTSKKRARSPAAPKATEKPEKAQTRSSKRAKKDAQDASAVAADGTDAQAEVVETPPVAVKTTTPAKTKDRTDTNKSNAPPAPAPAPAPASPSFGGNFDLYAMSLPFLSSVFTPARDYAALLATIRTYQAKPDNSAQIFLPADLGPSSGADGRFRSRAIEDPLEGMPFDVALSAPALADSVALGAREDAGSGSSDAFYSSSTPDSDARGVTASVGLEDDSHCGIASTRGVFKMRRAWASDDGQEEVFEGFFKIGIVYSGLYRRKCWEDGLDVSFAFWAVRARVGADGEEVGLGPGSE